MLCEWDIRARSVHYSKKNWLLNKSHTPGTQNIAHQPLVGLCKVLLPPVHIKLGIMKNCVKGLDRNGPALSLFVRNSQGLLWRSKTEKDTLQELLCVHFSGSKIIL
jgi:hypothetical protein